MFYIATIQICYTVTLIKELAFLILAIRSRASHLSLTSGILLSSRNFSRDLSVLKCMYVRYRLGP